MCGPDGKEINAWLKENQKNERGKNEHRGEGHVVGGENKSQLDMLHKRRAFYVQKKEVGRIQNWLHDKEDSTQLLKMGNDADKAGGEGALEVSALKKRMPLRENLDELRMVYENRETKNP